MAFGTPSEFWEELPSTMDRVAELARAGAPEGQLVVAERQTAGRGRLGRSWESPPGGLWLSLLLRPTLPLARIGLVGLGFALAAAETIQELVSLNVAIKWPNDLVCRERKLAGLLLETRGEAGKLAFAIFGLGINVNISQEAFPESLRDSAIALNTAAEKNISPRELLSRFLEKAEAGYNKLQAGDSRWLLERWPEFDLSRGRPMQIRSGNEQIAGIGAGIDENGALQLETPQGLRVITFGEVVWP
jgi:BirA family transcriptional regulator, biotin operon repressor / biotin---[acetyl-CoA-carboxylase] ligase